MIGVILVRTLHRDISRYNNADEAEDAQEEFGWKLVHGDVFRPPGNPMLLSVLLGTGSQIMGVVCVTLFFACLGFLSPATRGGLMTSMLVMYVFLGTPAGFVSSRMYKMFGGEQWKSNVICTAFLVPSLVFATFFVLNLILWANESSAAVPFGTLVALVAMWFCISVPLVSRLPLPLWFHSVLVAPTLPPLPRFCGCLGSPRLAMVNCGACMTLVEVICC